MGSRELGLQMKAASTTRSSSWRFFRRKMLELTSEEEAARPVVLRCASAYWISLILGALPVLSLRLCGAKRAGQCEYVQEVSCEFRRCIDR
jgi:hypothetical protein